MIYKPQRFQATLAKKEKISSKVYEVVFSLQNPQEMDYRSGHTIMIYIAPGVNRSMSIASCPSTKHEVTMCWDVSPMGPGCQWLLAKNIGDPVEFMGPLGIFLYDETSTKKAVFVATGTGVAPFYSTLREFLPTGTMQPSVLYFGLRHEEDMFWDSEFKKLAETYSSFQYNLVLSQPKEEWGGLKGHVNDYVFSLEKDLLANDYYLCGSGAMVDSMHQELVTRGVAETQIKKELFFKI